MKRDVGKEIEALQMCLQRELAGPEEGFGRTYRRCPAGCQAWRHTSKDRSGSKKKSEFTETKRRGINKIESGREEDGNRMSDTQRIKDGIDVLDVRGEMKTWGRSTQTTLDEAKSPFSPARFRGIQPEKNRPKSPKGTQIPTYAPQVSPTASHIVPGLPVDYYFLAMQRYRELEPEGRNSSFGNSRIQQEVIRLGAQELNEELQSIRKEVWTSSPTYRKRKDFREEIDPNSCEFCRFLLSKGFSTKRCTSHLTLS